ncbi:MAG: hypothetical protein FWD61_13650 [Phycisphaerales bacterium]|nr:hypothetical protein [Phycisphaerales bacterium]
MATGMQDILVMLVVAGSVLYLIRRARRAMNARCGRAGACCARRKVVGAPRPLAREGVAYLPVEMLRSKKD